MSWVHVKYSDIHGLHGGKGVWIAAGGEADVIVVAPGMWARRFRLHVSPQRLAELEGLMGQHDIATMNVPQADLLRGYAIPDESFATITLRTNEGEHTQRKSYHDTHPIFDLFQKWFLEMALEVAQGEMPISEGSWDYTWEPENYQAPVSG